MPDSKENYCQDQGVKGLNELWSHKTSTLWCVDGVFISFFLLAPYDTYRTTKESVIRAFWVQTSMEGQTQKLGVPMLINTTLHQDQFLTQDLLNELVWYMPYGFNPLTPKAWFTQAMQMRIQMQGFTHVSCPNANDKQNCHSKEWKLFISWQYHPLNHTVRSQEERTSSPTDKRSLWQSNKLYGWQWGELQIWSGS